ncbi:MAG TPA: site-2 protease family protein [Nitrospiria bacterium]|jgi:Zn-dependent protease|nr:site-2 protease family protein [Nitrospiria bacterium]
MNLDHIVQEISISAIPILLAVVFHEVAHGWVANKRGDPTARLMGRLTLNPLPHIDPVGTVIIPIFLLIATKGSFVFGYAKPVPVNFMNLRRPKEDMVWVAGAGPATNLLLAVACGFLFRLILAVDPSLLQHLRFGGEAFTWKDPSAMILDPVLYMLLKGVQWNVVLAVFNMIPIPPLDGGRVLVGLLPDRQAAAWASIEPFGFFIIIGLVFLDPFGFWSQIISPLIMNVMIWILGVHSFFF